MPVDFIQILQRLHAEGADFVVIGGMAMVSHGSAFVTNDLDLCHRRTAENLGRIVRALAPLHPRLRGAPADLPFLFDEATLRAGLNFTFVTDAGNVDLLGEVKGVGGYDEVRAEAIAMDIEGQSTLVMGLEQLIAAKRASRRRKDLLHLDELEEILKRRRRG